MSGAQPTRPKPSSAYLQHQSSFHKNRPAENTKPASAVLQRTGSFANRQVAEAALAELRKRSESQKAIDLSVVAGQNLVAKDSESVLKLGWSKSTSDPYVVCTYGSHRFKTAVARKTLNPKWNARCTWIIDGARFDPTATLMLKIFDRDACSLDDPMGQVWLHIWRIYLAYPLTSCYVKLAEHANCTR